MRHQRHCIWVGLLFLGLALALLGGPLAAPVSADEYLLDASTCGTVLNGTWDAASSTCTISVDWAMIGRDRTLTIPVGTTLHIGSNTSMDNWGTLINAGTIINDSSLYSDSSSGTFINSGVVINNDQIQLYEGSTFTNSGTITNRNYFGIGSSCLLHNTAGGVIENYALLYTTGTIKNEGTISNLSELQFVTNGTLNNTADGVVENYAVLNNGGIVNNSGVINAHCGASYVGTGTFTGNAIEVVACAPDELNGATCGTVLNGAWDAASSTCTILVDWAMIRRDSTLTIPVGTTLHIGSNTSMDNWGTLINAGTLINDSSLYSDSSSGTFINSGVVINNDQIQLYEGSTFTNSGTITNRNYFGIGSSCLLHNTAGGVIENSAVLNNTGTVDNSGVINAYCGASYTGGGTFTGNPIVNACLQPATVTLGNLTQTYDGQPKAVTVTTDPAGLKVEVTYNGSAAPPVNAGSYAVVATINEANYQGSASGTLTINKRAASVTAVDTYKTFGQDNPALKATVVGQAAGGDIINYSLSTAANQCSNAGSYPIVVTLGSNPNYNVSTTNGTLTINKKAASVTAANKSKAYGDDNPVLTATATGAVCSVGIDYSLSTTAVKCSDVGDYPIAVTLGANPNYNVSTTDATLAINKKAASVTAANKSKAYGDDNPVLTATAAGAVCSTSISYSLSTEATKCSAVGDYPILVTLGSSPNYNVTATNGTLAINKKAASVTAANKSKTYGDDNPALTATATGAVCSVGIDYSLSTTSVECSDVGDYPIAVTLGANPNYNVTTTNGTLAINKKAASVTAANKSKTYGDDNPALTATATGAVCSVGIDYSLSTTAVKCSNAGDYPIVVELGANPNYNVSTTDATLTVNKKAASVTAANKSKAYGDDNPVLTATAAGAVCSVGVNYSLSTTAVKCSNASDYPIVVELGANPNYNVSTTNATLTVDTKAASVTADAKTKTYGQDNPELTATVIGEASGCDAIGFNLSTTAGKYSGVGSYPIVVAVGSTPNYNVTKANGTLTIEPAPLTVTPDDWELDYTEPNPPAFAFQYSGWIEGEGPTNPYLTAAPSCQTTRERLSPAGAYPITCSGGVAPNYEITYVAGTFTVSKEGAEITYTGDTQVTTAKEGARATVTLAATLEEEQDGWLGDQLAGQQVLFQAFGFGDTTYTTPLAGCTAEITNIASGKGYGSCTVDLPASDPYQVKISLVTNPYHAAQFETMIVLVNDPGTGMTAGGGWLIDPNSGSRANFGFTAKFLKKGKVQGNSLFVYRVTTDLSTIVPDAPAGERAYDWIIKSNAMQGLNIYDCDKTTTSGCKATITGKTTVQAVDRLTGVLYSIGGNYQFQVDVTDNQEPGSSGTGPDQYAIRIWDNSGTYYELGNSYDDHGMLLSPVDIGAGNIQVKAKK